MHPSYLLDFARSTPWAILPSKLETVRDVLNRHAAGVKLSAAEIEAAIGPGRGAGQVRRGPKGVAVLPVYGLLAPKANMVTDFSGGTSAEKLQHGLRAAVEDASVQAIVLDVDSPGGSVQGIEELSNAIFQARPSKPIVAVVNHTAASAAYWLAAQAHRIVTTPSGELGSVGVYAMHVDQSAADEAAGMKYTTVSAGRYKTEGDPHRPLSDADRAALQAQVDERYSVFVQHVARGRGVRVGAVRDGFGQGRVVTARDAIRLGMADRLGSLASEIQSLAA